MIKPLDTIGRPTSDDTNFVVEMFDARKVVRRKDIVRILGCDNTADRTLKYLKNKNYIKNIGRGIWKKKRHHEEDC